MKKIISILTLLAILLTMTAIFASCGGGQQVPDSVSKSIGESKVMWTYDNQTYTLKIIGDEENPLPMFSDKKLNETTAKDMPWDYLRNYIYEVRLEGITNVPAYAFYSMPALKSVNFGKNVTEIGKCAFAFCRSYSLADVSKADSSQPVTLPEGITYIGDSAFEGCSSLTKINLPSTLVDVENSNGTAKTVFGNKVFAYNYNLKEVVKAEKLTLPENTFDLLNKTSTVTVTNLEDIKAEESTPSTPEEPSGSESVAPESESTTDSTATESESSTENNKEEPDTTTMIIAISIFAVVIIGVAIGGFLLYRSNKKQTKDARTVRKNDNEKTDEKKNDKAGKNGKNTKNGKNAKKGKKK